MSKATKRTTSKPATKKPAKTAAKPGKKALRPEELNQVAGGKDGIDVMVYKRSAR